MEPKMKPPPLKKSPTGATTITISSVAATATAITDNSITTTMATKTTPSFNVRENAHTHVLGRDVGDFETNYTSQINNSNSTDATLDNTTTDINTPSRINRRFVRSQAKENNINSEIKEKSNNDSPSPTTVYQPISSPSIRRPANDAADRENSAAVEARVITNSNDATSNGENNRNRWWTSRIFGGSRNDGNSDNISSKNIKKNMNNRRISNGKVADANYECLSTVASSSTTKDSATATAITELSTEAAGTTREDHIKQNCSFFYKGMEDNPSSPFDQNNSRRMIVGRRARARARGEGRMRNIIPSSNSLLRNVSSRHSRISSGRDGALFMSKYERLNQVIERKKYHQQHYDDHSSSHNNDDNDNDNDLFLDEEDPTSASSCYREHIPNPTNNVVMDATSLTNPHGVRSSLFYEQDGQMLMRLPRDHVRLVMDYDLEPGILSVEQWRNREDAERTAVEAMTAMTTRTTEREHRQQQYRRRLHQKKRRRRRHREEEKQQQELKEIFDVDTNRNSNDIDIDKDDDPLKTEGGGQQPIEVVQDLQQQSRRRQQQHLKNEYLYDGNEYYSDDDDYSDDYYDIEELGPEHPTLLPELNYVITVPNDLYRRMVGEMSAAAFPPYWGFFKCCSQESERADIKLALAVLSVVMLLLGVGSLEWPTE